MTLRSFDVIPAREDSQFVPFGAWMVGLGVAAAKLPRVSAPKQTRRRALTDMRRAEIIAAALKVFAKKGFHSTRAEDVAAQARIAKGTLYLYFDSKEAIYEAALAHAMEQLLNIVESRLESVETTQERVRVFVESRLEFWASQGELYRMLMTIGREKKQKKQTAEILRESVDRLLVILHEGIDRGEMQYRTPEPLGWAMMDMMRGVNERRVDGLQTSTVAEDAALITEMAMRYFTRTSS